MSEAARTDEATGVYRLKVTVFAATLLLSAGLLFTVQPMFAKLLLPLFGGTSAVWNTAMLFFQGALLAGYGYAHVSATRLTPRLQVIIHVALLAATLLLLPIGLPDGWAPSPTGHPIVALIGVMTITVGLPFVVVSATAPLIQSWFSRSRIRGAEDPYFLYAASNAGSMLGLVSYPLIIEPLLRLREQALAWTGGFVLLGAMIVACGLALFRASADSPSSADVSRPAQESALARPIPWRRRLLWIALSAVPSSLLMGVTTHITTDVASVPLFWIGPLLLYLLSFVIAFSKAPLPRHAWVLLATPHIVLLFALASGWLLTELFVVLTIHLTLLFTLALMCHGRLAADRPDPVHLTEFYLLISFGGMLGGVFNALVAPLIFNDVYEYPLAVVAACMLLPGRKDDRIALGVGFAALILAAVVAGYFLTHNLIAILMIKGAFILWIFAWRDRPLHFGLGVAALLAAPIIWQVVNSPNIERKRNFFGIHTVALDPTGRYLKLTHGTTLHGAQDMTPERRKEPLTYYAQEGPAGQIMTEFASDHRNVGIIGLGSGAMACYRHPGQDWTFYEIDPDMVETARNGRHFTYLKDCAPDARMVIGDARLSLTAEPAGRFDLLVVDAFSSDSIPVHLMTREAFALYSDKLTANGLLLVHVSNRHMDLAPLVARIGAEQGMESVIRLHPVSAAEIARMLVPSEWVLLSRDPAVVARLAADDRWRRPAPNTRIRVWTDDYSNVLSVLGR